MKQIGVFVAIRELYKLLARFYLFLMNERRLKLHPYYERFQAWESLYPYKKKNIVEKFLESELLPKNPRDHD
ncbi:MAG: hypothetical protein OXJ38_05310 [Gammaproteobacteria bacterium]|nr:hypothetical protein [Gammaproteobacteria bacterium]